MLVNKIGYVKLVFFFDLAKTIDEVQPQRLHFSTIFSILLSVGSVTLGVLTAILATLGAVALLGVVTAC